MSDADVAALLSGKTRTVQRESIPGAELLKHTDFAEYRALADAQKQQWLALAAIAALDKSAVLSFVEDIFPANTNTWANILAASSEPGSRAQELGLGRVTPSAVAKARRI